MIDPVTEKWMRNKADERAYDRGARFNPERGEVVLKFAENCLCLYEGELAGQPFIPADWQVEATMRLFGWEVYSERFKRKVRRFTQASIWVPKKNGKSPTIAWWALYLLCADGEQGQKVYLAAKDGQQAREIAGKHAIEMCQSSTLLMRQCTINKSLMQITHERTRSILKPISSSDSKAQKAKEGLNGSILIDETHVVDREFVSRISRAGISRSEPLFCELSTAGDDPESYGKERFDYGQAVNDGKEDNDSLMFLSYAAPQELTDNELAADPAKYGRMANPTMGRIVDEKEYLDDYNTSRRSIALLADFKKYRLNIWQRSANPWLPAGSWEACEEDFSEADLYGMPCYGGLDLARTRDTSALVLIFPMGDGTFRVLCYHWLPKARADELRGDVKYLEWAAQNWIELTPGDVCDYAFIRERINDIRSKYQLEKLAFDGTYAEQMMQRLAMEDGMALDSQEKFGQTIMNFAGPTAMFERFVVERKVRHNGNPILTWQMGNVMIKTDVNQNLRPIKQKYGDKRTIDGSVAAIMALAMADKYQGQSCQILVL